LALRLVVTDRTIDGAGEMRLEEGLAFTPQPV
jgi:hypothetical protein